MDVLIVGAGGYGRVVADVIEKQGMHKIAGFVDDQKPCGHTDYGYSVIGSTADIGRLSRDIPGGIIAVGDNWTRFEIVQQIRSCSPKFTFVQAIHPTVCLARESRVGDGAVLLAGVILSSNAVVGNHAALFIGAILGHDSRLGDYASLGPRAVLAGNVAVGPYSVIAAGATVIHQINIGENSVIGAGSTVVRDVPDHVVAYGMPARIQKGRSAHEKYL